MIQKTTMNSPTAEIAGAGAPERRRMATAGSRNTTKKRKITEEEIIGYLTKKAQKTAMQVTKKLKSQTVSGYSNDSNPFRDSNLGEIFVWLKKIERDVTQGAPLHSFSVKAEKKRQRERMEEMEKLVKRREERAIDNARCEGEIEMLATERASAEADVYEERESEFLFNQAKIRSRIRLREGRPKPIDILINYVDESVEFVVQLNHPCMIFHRLTVGELELLHKDIKLCLDVDREAVNRMEFWQPLSVLCHWELGKVMMDGVVQERSLHSSIVSDVESFLEGKNYDDLVALQSQIESDLLSVEAKVVEYWEAVLNRIDIYKAKACLNQFHGRTLRKRKQQLEQPLEDGKALKMRDLTPQEGDAEVAVMVAVFPVASNRSPASQLLHDEDKHLLKPKYFAKVHAAYQWNKYNRRHYDHDNPPPKAIQGYKFNILYPQLISKKMPEYFVEEDGDRTESCILRFHGGPPYEDIAFRIANRDWDFCRKKGFKFTFEGGILRLYFNFKSYHYRR